MHIYADIQERWMILLLFSKLHISMIKAKCVYKYNPMKQRWYIDRQKKR